MQGNSDPEEGSLSNEDASLLEAHIPPSALSNPQEDDAILEEPLLPSLDPPPDNDVNNTATATAAAGSDATAAAASLAASPANLGVRAIVRSRKTGKSPQRKHRGVRFHRSRKTGGWGCLLRRLCCFAQNKVIRCMNLTARVVLWSTIIALCVGVVWYSYELYKNRTDAHRIAWFSAGAFVLLGFPISMWGIVKHLSNYNQPHVQVYVVRILFMVPVYSIQSWLAMRLPDNAIYFETLRDLYESYVLYSFLQFLIQVLGGEESLILMLKDKSPTRGAHMWGLQWCVKPWLMGQPVRKTVYERDDESGRRRPMKRVIWTSPFFIKCKFGVLQYVLLKFVSAIFIMILELNDWYKEGKFTWKGGYLYLCFVTNLSQCWAVYCLVFFYYATHTELSPIRPVGKFLAVKALVFFTWYQSVVLAILVSWNVIPEYTLKQQEWAPADVAKAIQDYLICIEMFAAAVVHTFIFPHTEYSPQAVEARTRAINQTPMKWQRKRLGRSKYANHYLYGPGRDNASLSDVEMVSLSSAYSWEENTSPIPRRKTSYDFDSTSHPNEPVHLPPLSPDHQHERGEQLSPVLDLTEEEDGNEEDEADEATGEGSTDDGDDDDEFDDEEILSPTVRPKTNFVRALWDTAIPREMVDHTVSLVKGDYHVEKKTLLHHATTSDQYDLFSRGQYYSSPRDRENKSHFSS